RRGAARRQDRGIGNSRRVTGPIRFVRPYLPGSAERRDGGRNGGPAMNGSVLVGESRAAPARSLAGNLASLLQPWRGRVVAVVLFVLAAGTFELGPPVQAMTFLYSYLAAMVAQGVLSDLRIRLYAHVQRRPVSLIDRTPIGDTVSRGTSDVEAIDTVFSSGIAILVANLLRLLTLHAGMAMLSPALTLVAALVAPPLVITLRFLQVRVRQSERETRIAVGALTSRLQENLRGIEIIRAFGREREAVGGFRRVLSDALA